jgi:hypothetical protein
VSLDRYPVGEASLQTSTFTLFRCNAQCDFRAGKRFMIHLDEWEGGGRI